jgi:hypothetical protein
MRPAHVAGDIAGRPEDFKEGSPLVPIIAIGDPALPVQTFGRIESGGRAIDPLYPNFLTSKDAEVLLADLSPPNSNRHSGVADFAGFCEAILLNLCRINGGLATHNP